MNNWKNSEIDFLKHNYRKFSYPEISKRISRSLQSVYWKAFELKLNKGRWNADNRLNKEKVIEMLQKEAKKLGKSPSVREVPISIKSACQRHFGNFNKAKKVAGIKVRNSIKKLPKSSYNSSKDLAYIVGLILGDGSFRYQQSKERTSYVIVYVTKDKELMDFFLHKFKKWSGFNLEKISIRKGGYKRFPGGRYSYYQKTYCVQICFREAWIFLKQFKDDPESCLNFFPIVFQNWLLKGLWDAEGCIRAPRPNSLRIHFSNTNNNIITLYTKLLNNFNFNYSINKIRGCSNVDVLDQSEMRRFIRLIRGITIRRKSEILNKNPSKI